MNHNILLFWQTWTREEILSFYIQNNNMLGDDQPRAKLYPEFYHVFIKHNFTEEEKIAERARQRLGL